MEGDHQERALVDLKQRIEQSIGDLISDSTMREEIQAWLGTNRFLIILFSLMLL
jgi:hypothetical protein